MSIATAITAAQGRVADCYTAISNKGGTLPETQNLANMPTAISSITTTPNIQSLSVTPTTSSQTITASGGVDGYSPISVSAVTSSIDANITAGNIKNGVSILGVQGTYTGSSSTKYNCTVDNFLGNTDANGVLSLAEDTSGTITFTGVKNVGKYALAYKFYMNTNITQAVSFPDLENVTNDSALYYTFMGTNVSNISLPKLKTVTGQNAMYGMFQSTKITSLSLPELETVSGNTAMRNFVYNCSSLATVSLPKLKTVSTGYGIAYFCGGSKITTISLPELTTLSGTSCFNNFCTSCSLLETASFPKLSDVSAATVFTGSFASCKAITDIYFNALTTTSFGSSYINQFHNMFNGNATSGTAATSGNVNVHFPSNLSSTISGLTGYPLFGGASGKVTLLFDLPQTS